MRFSLEIVLYIGIRILCGSIFTWYMIESGPSLWEGLFTLFVLGLLCTGVDGVFKSVFFERAAYDYLANVDYLIEVKGSGVAIDKTAHQLVAANPDWVIVLDAISVEDVTLSEEGGHCLLVIDSCHEVVPRLVLNFYNKRDARTDAYERLKMLTRLYRGSRLRERSPEPVLS